MVVFFHPRVSFPGWYLILCAEIVFYFKCVLSGVMFVGETHWWPEISWMSPSTFCQVRPHLEEEEIVSGAHSVISQSLDMLHISLDVNFAEFRGNGKFDLWLVMT